MTQEQKAAVERAAEENGWVAVFSFTKGAEHVIDNPSDFGLVEKRLVDAGVQIRIETVKACEETHLKNEKYREALESLECFTSDNPDYEFINHRLKEALKTGGKQ